MKVAFLMAFAWALPFTSASIWADKVALAKRATFAGQSGAGALEEWQLMSSMGLPPEPTVSYIVGTISIHHPSNEGRDVDAIAYNALMREHIRFDMSSMKNQTCFTSQASLGYLVARILKADSRKHHYFVEFAQMYK